jgi:hypothetical protein
MGSRVIHMGLGKTGTTSLQRKVFPMMFKKRIVDSYNPHEIFDILYQFAQTGNERVLQDLNFDKYPSLLISCEGLVGWNPSMWLTRVKTLAKYIPPDVVVILTLRSSEDYARSAYQQSFNEGSVKDENIFFIDSKGYSDDFGLSGFFDIHHYSYPLLVDNYSRKFENLVVLPYENIFNLNFLNDLYIINDVDFKELKLALGTSKKYNRSLSKEGMAILGLLSVFLSSFNLKFISNMEEVMISYRKDKKCKISISSKFRRRFFSYFYTGSIFFGRPYALHSSSILSNANKVNNEFYQKILSTDSGYLFLHQKFSTKI